MFQAVSFLSGTDRYSLKVLRELPPQVGKPISEGAEAARKSGLISACSFRQPQMSQDWARQYPQCGLGALMPTQRAASIPTGLLQQQWTGLRGLKKVWCLC